MVALRGADCIALFWLLLFVVICHLALAVSWLLLLLVLVVMLLLLLLLLLLPF